MHSMLKERKRNGIAKHAHKSLDQLQIQPSCSALSRSSPRPLCHPLVTTPEWSHYQNHQERERAWGKRWISVTLRAFCLTLHFCVFLFKPPCCQSSYRHPGAWNALKKHLTSRHPWWHGLWIHRESALVQWYRDRTGSGVGEG